MALSRVKIWIAGEVLTASDLNTEINNLINNSGDLVFPVTANMSFKSGTSFTVTFDHAATADRTITIPDAAGTVKLTGTETIWIPAASMTPRTTNGPSTGTTELATNDIMLKTLDFDQTTSEGAQFSILMPKSWDESTVTFRAVWTAASGTGTVTWTVKGLATSDDDAMDAALGTGQSVTDTLLTANDNHTTSISSAITIAGTPAEGDLVFFEVSRDIADTLNADARLIGVHVYITTNAPNDA